MSWQPTIGTLSANTLAETLASLEQDAGDMTAVNEIAAHIAALTAQLERARSIAVNLEQELAQRGAGIWPVRQYATVELPDELLLTDADMHRIGAHIAGSVDVDGQVADAGMGNANG